MNFIISSLDSINGWLYTYYLVVLLVFAGIFLSFKFGFVQIRMFIESLKVATEKVDKDVLHPEHISPFQALMISTASKIGIGNIAGIAFAITAGGAGAIFWMWVMAFFGGASAFAESTLAQIYKSKDGNGFKGGPAYYITKALSMKWIGTLFAITLILTYAYGFNGLQSYTMTSAFQIYTYATTWEEFRDSGITIYIGAILAILTTILFFSKSYTIGKVSSIIVPYMAIAYTFLAVIAIILNYEKIPEVLTRIFEEAFDFKAIFGGFAGSTIAIGIKRGLFSNEAGMGSAPNAAAAAHTSHPAKQGLIQSLAVFIDVFICTSTAFLVLFSTKFIGKGQELTALPLVQQAMQEYFGNIGLHFVSAAIALFAITSLIGNYYYAQANIKYLTNNRIIMFLFKVSAVAMVFIGAQMNLILAWSLADILMAGMATLNILAILFLSDIVKRTLQDYMIQKKAGEEPVFKAKELGIKNAECWE
ncbi:alanine/glycine:cation symporter family protein [Campylobacter fetus]|uniref:Amino acid carrier protein n=1 Tax=Campylobacter fetus subsp. testudinum TaxID=1507806 RepID=A0AAX0HBQ9_CAMFE|nr:alanine/glycine:cation symporter family protein [Campylobacter fetus]ALV64850.1 Na+/alanine symporter family protein [Campylobacter fetus subsp. testudinum Sp3]EAK0826105.1 alanine:cation symporter family protein [Campylobacter fetus]OCR91038.1 amino acid carrier protein [Campylobacter fetus subsp. testudinum]OCR93474.1 amino acid carrier protein [Campylobacter fetus subsp. testudinum]OCS04646.1 amino acid carrier protein [Campylobacter fetus subsp. testudinum]